jgi:hypothetical protein
MARKVISTPYYTFTPSTKTITIPGYIAWERIALITNVTANKVLYNFSDPSLKATFSYSRSGASTTTIIVLNYNTSTMLSSDEIQIFQDEYAEKFTGAEELMDPVGKLRTSYPQALIDTDFEYGTQVTKWENLTMINNRPLAYQTIPNITNLASMSLSTSSRTVTVTTSSNHYLSVGSPIVVQDTYLSIANGNFIIDTVPSGTTFTYTARAINTTSITSILDANKTAIYSANLYQNSQIGSTPTISVTGTAVTVTTTVNHGLAIGNEVAVTGITGTNPPNGAFIVATVTSPTIFTYYATGGTPSGLTTTSAAVYVRPQGQFLHRPFDGGVIFTTNGASNYEQSIRQTRRYFRYQSGKGIQVSTGTILKPNLQIDALTSSGTTVTVQTKEQHNIIPGASITVYGANETAYNGTFAVTSVTGYNTFQYTALSTPSASPASGTYYIGINSWYGAANRVGLFDSQNGMFWEHDGQNLNVVRRNSTFQISGKVSVTNGSHSVTQTNSSLPTNFSRQLIPGDYIVLRGFSYRVTEIISDTSLNITPAYRGTTDNYVIASKTQELRIPQSQFNIDKLDGSGPSGYVIDTSKMQMWFVDFAWYGAGVIRFGVRATDGNIIYCHKIANNNVNAEAYLRSGNLPARYESLTLPPSTFITTSIGASDTSINVGSTTSFPSSGTLLIKNNSIYEYINYTGKTSTTFTGLTRGQAGNSSLALTIASGSNSASVSSASGLQVGQRIIAPSNFPDNTFIAAISGTTLTLSQAALTANPTVIVPPMAATSGQVFTYSATAPVGVEFAYPTYAPTISHWGTSVIMDGGFDDDKSIVFTYGQSVPVVIPANGSRALFSIRIAPSVDNGVGTGFGQRELINRMQLVLRTLDISTSTSGAQLLVKGFINNTTFAGAQSILGQTVGTPISISTITPSSPAAGSVTYTTSTNHGLNVGNQVVITNLSTSGYNGTYVVTAVGSATQFTVTNSTTGGTTTGQTGNVIGYAKWTNAVSDVYGQLTSSLAQVADYAPASTGGSAGAYTTSAGETTGGFFVNGTSSIDLAKLRDLGNSILGGGGVGTPAYSNTNIYPDGPDVLTITVQNLTSSPVTVYGRIAWTEAQA